MENSGFWSKQNAADYLFSKMIEKPQNRLIKLNNWITRKRIPKKCMGKIGKEIIFFEDVLKEWVAEEKRKAA